LANFHSTKFQFPLLVSTKWLVAAIQLVTIRYQPRAAVAEIRLFIHFCVLDTCGHKCI